MADIFAGYKNLTDIGTFRQCVHKKYAVFLVYKFLPSLCVMMHEKRTPRLTVNSKIFLYSIRIQGGPKMTNDIQVAGLSVLFYWLQTNTTRNGCSDGLTDTHSVKFKSSCFIITKYIYSFRTEQICVLLFVYTFLG